MKLLHCQCHQGMISFFIDVHALMMNANSRRGRDGHPAFTRALIELAALERTRALAE